jgi:hypothetical protein
MADEAEPRRRTIRTRDLLCITGLLVVGIAIRIYAAGLFVPAWEASAGVASFPDAYPTLARSILDDGVLGYGIHGASPTTVRGPGFPLWLALGMLFGLAGPAAIGIWTALPGILCGGLIAFLLARRYGWPVGWIGGLIAVAHPLPVFVSARAMGDEFYGVLGFLAIVGFVAAGRSASHPTRGAVLSGLVAALQVLTRATGILTMLTIGITGFVIDRRLRNAAIIVLLTASIPVAAWSIRSSLLEQRPVLVHSLVGYNFWFGEALYLRGTGSGETRETAVAMMAEKAEMPRLRDPGFWYARLTPAETSQMERRLLRAAWQRLIDQPGSYIKRCAWGVLRFWVGAEMTRRSMQYALVGIPLVLFAIIGVAQQLSRSRPDPVVFPLALSILLHNLAYAATWPMARMSVQIYPALAYLSAIGIYAIMQRLSTLAPSSPARDAPSGP